MPDGEIVTLDGKTLRGSHDWAKEQDAIDIVSAWVVSERLTVGQVKVSKGSNEITTVPEVLRSLNVRLYPAGRCAELSEDDCRTIREQKADYLLALKNNHKSLRAEEEEFLTSVREDRTRGFEIRAHQTTDSEHVRIETRRYWQATAPDFLADKAAWLDLRSVRMVEATREINGQQTTEPRYYLSSLPVNSA